MSSEPAQFHGTTILSVRRGDRVAMGGDGQVTLGNIVVKAIQLAGKRVILANLNELNAALLEAMGVNRYAILVRRKST